MGLLNEKLGQRRNRLSEDARRNLEAQARAELTAEEKPVPVQPESGLIREGTIGWAPIDDVYPMGTGFIYDSEETPRKQPRKYFDPVALAKLTKDIAENEQQVPATVRVIGVRDGRIQYGIIKGERRYWASKDAKKTMFLVRLKSANDRLAYRMAVLDDIHNVSHTATERGVSLAEMQIDLVEELKEYLQDNDLDKPLTELALNQIEDRVEDPMRTPAWIARVLRRAAKTNRRPKVIIDDLCVMTGFADRTVRNYLSHANLSTDILSKVEDYGLKVYHLNALASLKTAEGQQMLLEEIKAKNLNEKEAEERAASIKARLSKAPKPVRLPTKPLRDLIARTKRATKVKIPEDAPEEARAEGRALVAELEKLTVQLKEKWG